MEARSQEMRKMEESLKNQLKEHADQLDRAIQEFREQQSKDMEEVRTMLVKLACLISSQSSSSCISCLESGKECGFTSAIQPKFAMLEFPKFHGEGLNEWLCKCKQYFDFDETSDDIKVRMASLHLEGRALVWHQNYMRYKGNQGVLQWEEYIHALSIRFGEALYLDPIAELKQLEQVGTLETYLDKFDEILNRLDLCEDYAVSLFLSGLKEEIRYPVRVFSPSNLVEAVRLAKLQELIVEKLHKEDENYTEDNQENTPMIPLNGLAGVPSLCNYRTMRVNGSIKGQKVHILISSGSTHNLIDANTVNRLGCTVASISPVTVVVADGSKIQCEKTCVDLKWKMQGQEFQDDVLVMPLNGCQMVLGIQWLILLGPIIWNFKQLSMEFTVGNKKVVLRGA